MFNMNAGLQRQKDTLTKHVDDLEKALTHHPDKIKYMRLEMIKVQDPISKPKLASAQVDKQKDLTGSDKF